MNIIRRWKKRELNDWVSDLDESRITLYVIYFFIIMFSIIEVIIGLFLVKKNINYVIGITLGTIVAVILVRNMYSVIGRAVVSHEGEAEAMVRKGAIFRMLFIFVVFVCVINLRNYINIYAMMISTLNLKFAAYMVPLTNITKGR